MLSLREIYNTKCEELACKCNSHLMKILPNVPNKYDSVECLDMSTNFVGPRGLIPVLEVVRHCTALKTLILKDNMLTNASVQDISDYCVTHRTLTSIDLSSNPITLIAGKSLLEMLQKNERIVDLKIEGTNIRPMMMKSIQAVLDRNVRLMQNANPWNNTIKAQKHKGDGISVEHDYSLDQNSVRQLLAALPHTTSSILFDLDPVDSFLLLCEQHDAFFKDTQFPPTSDSVSPVNSALYPVASWRRVTEIVKNAVLFPDHELNPMGIAMGAAESSNILACLSAIVTRSKAKDQPIRDLFNPKKIAPSGVYSVKFFIDGKWRYVIIDDYIPCNESGLPLFLRPKLGSEVWILLLEKALAKLHGSYHALDQAQNRKHALTRPLSAAVLMMDLTGGVAVSRDFTHSEFNSDAWWETMQSEVSRGTMLVAYCDGAGAEAKQAVGLTPCHMYFVTYARSVNGFRLIRLRSPWASQDWKGEWGDSSTLWEQYPDVKNDVLGLVGPEEQKLGFWISYAQFLKYFSSVHINKTFDGQKQVIVEGRWEGKSCGGPNFSAEWCNNPHFHLSVKERGVFCYSLALPDSRFRAGCEVDTIGLHVMQSDYYPLIYDADILSLKTGYFISDSVTSEHYVNPGTFWAVPSTYSTGQASPFILRVFSTGDFAIRAHTIENFWKEIAIQGQWRRAPDIVQTGVNNLQFQLVIPTPEVNDKGELVSRTSTQQLVVTMNIDGTAASPLSGLIYVCIADSQRGQTAERILGPIPDDKIIQKSKFLTASTISLRTALPSGAYIVVCSLYPPGSSSSCRMQFWCTATNFSVRELRLWNEKDLTVDVLSSGQYQFADGNPQFEIVPSAPMKLVITAKVTHCNDPSLAFFIVDNSGSAGKPLKGLIPDAKVLLRSPLVRGDVVSAQLTILTPLMSYVVIPCIQPPGCSGKVVLTVSGSCDDYQFRRLLG